MSRRGLLQLGIFTGLLGTVGCSEDQEAKKIDTPPAPTGNRKRLDQLQKKTEETTPVKKK
ncbi:MAG: hypothetical protein ACLQGP_11770 [Isosphaeraceae bacterium]